MSASNPYKRIEMAEDAWVVVCLGRPLRDADLPASFDPDTDDGREPALATRSAFASREDAVRYVQSINPAWRPLIAKLEAP